MQKNTKPRLQKNTNPNAQFRPADFDVFPKDSPVIALVPVYIDDVVTGHVLINNFSALPGTTVIMEAVWSLATALYQDIADLDDFLTQYQAKQDALFKYNIWPDELQIPLYCWTTI